MPVSQATLLNFAAKAPMQKSAEVINFAKASRKQTAFLSHSHKNADLAKGVQAFLQAEGWDVYIDWEDSGMPESPNRETAERIQAKIRDLNWFLFLATKNSTESRWCPWEIGYADGVKKYENILIIPTSDGNKTHGNEYLELYRRIEVADAGGYGAFPPGTSGIKISALAPL